MNFTRVGRTARSVNGLKTCYRKLSAGANQNGNPASGKVDMVGIAFFGAISAATLGLGLWQTKRYFWKVDLIEELKRRLGEEPLCIAPFISQTDLSELLEKNKGRRIAITGKFDHSKEIKLGPRSAPLAVTGSNAQGMATNPQGFYIITPLVSDKDTVVFVNRGWVPRNSSNFSRPEGKVVVNGLVGSGEKSGTFSPEQADSSRILIWLDLKTLVAGSGLGQQAEPVIYLEQLDDTATVNTFPAAKRLEFIGEQEIGGVNPATHMVYALTWFSLATAGCFMTYYKFRPSKRIMKGFQRKPKD